jgi:hypothetical protein
MTAGMPETSLARGAVAHAAAGSGIAALRAVAITAGIAWSVLFIVVGLAYRLQQYGDGSMFSYAVAVEDVWAFHWHNISGRLLVYLVTCVPAELYVALTSDPSGGIVVYGFLFFVMQLAGLAATFAADRPEGRIIFVYACASTACLCPLVFGFPTEMWAAHALFWPTLAVCHYARRGIAGAALVFAMLLALAFTHEAAPLLELVILATLLLRGIRDAAFLRAACAFLVVMAIWALAKETVTPDDYDGPMMARAALLVFQLSILESYILVLLVSALAGYGIVFVLLRRLGTTNAYLYAAALVAVALAVYWLEFDRALHADQRYPMRTVLLVVMAGLGGLAAAYALDAEGRLKLRLPLLARLMAALRNDGVAEAALGAILVVMLVHAVELAKFVRAWTGYEGAVRTLAMGTASDPALGDPNFVSSDRIAADLNRLSWFSTTPYLSVLVAPGFAPRRLVVDPTGNYFWLSCATATANEKADRVVPLETRRLVRVYACLHR